MEALLIRGFVLVLALSGFGASTVSSTSSSANASHSGVVSADGGGTLPTCPLNDPNNCGM